MRNERSRRECLVDPAWVSGHLDDPGVRLIEVNRVGTEAYETGHIPGAVGWNWKAALWDERMREFPTPEEMARRLGAVGIRNGTTIVIYGVPFQYGTYPYWVLRLLGHPDVRLLDGGKTRWQQEGRPLTRDVPTFRPVPCTPATPNPAIRILREEVLGSLGKPGVAILDVRSPEEYRGERVAPPGHPDGGAERTGRIPGARHLYFMELINGDGTFKSPAQIRRLVEDRGITPDKEVIVYCRLSHRASLAWFALHELLGYPKVRSYDGSWTEWGSVVGVPIER